MAKQYSIARKYLWHLFIQKNVAVVNIVPKIYVAAGRKSLLKKNLDHKKHTL